jgi:hypothetical protein
VYSLFENIMNLGVKELYYREELTKKTKDSSPLTFTSKQESFKSLSNNPLQSFNSFGGNSHSSDNTPIDREKQQRQRKQKLLELNQEDAQKTALKKRSNKIFNNYLKEIDSKLYYHIQEMEVQPELILLKWLRCLLSREFSI